MIRLYTSQRRTPVRANCCLYAVLHGVAPLHPAAMPGAWKSGLATGGIQVLLEHTLCKHHIFEYFGNMPSYTYHTASSNSRLVKYARHKAKLIVAVTIFFVLAYFALSSKGFISRIRVESELADRRHRVVALEREIQNLQQERDLLKNDMKTIEHVARESHGMVKPGEIVYRILPARKQASK
jgi:cell division protein FtsB